MLVVTRAFLLPTASIGSHRCAGIRRALFSTMTSNEHNDSVQTLRVLALHGSEGTSDSMQNTMQMWNGYFSGNHGLQLEVTTVQAPFPKGSGYAWWMTAPPNSRSFTATSYEGFEESAKLVGEALEKYDFDLLVGHSQGAILLLALLALRQLPESPRQRLILNGVAWPNPYTKEMKKKDGAAMHDVLFLMGQADRINPLEQARRVEDALREGGYSVTTIDHPGGHSMPSVKDGETMQRIAEWVLRSGPG